jgi:hypothetical protein
MSKKFIQRVSDKCKRINRNRSNYIETLVLEDLKKDEPKTAIARTAAEAREEIALRLG